MANRPARKPPSLSIEASLAIQDGNIIEAIKLVRERDGISLAEAKARVDAHIAQNPVLQEHLAQRQREQRAQFVKWLVVAELIFAAAVVYWFFGR